MCLRTSDYNVSSVLFPCSLQPLGGFEGLTVFPLVAFCHTSGPACGVAITNVKLDLDGGSGQ
jgi:hypothetical protein